MSKTDRMLSDKAGHGNSTNRTPSSNRSRIPSEYAALVMDMMRETLLVLDLDLRVMFANKSFYHHFGLLPEETEGRLIYELGNGQWDIPELHRLLEEILPKSHVFDDFRIENDFERIGHREMRVDVRRLVERDRGLIMLTFEDVTERKRIEEALRKSEERFRVAFEQAAVGMAHVAPDGTWLRANRKFSEIVGYSLEELSQLTFQQITHPDDRDASRQLAAQLLENVMETASLEKRYIRKDGSVVWINLTTALVRGDAGKPEYFISVYEDISDRKRTERILLEQNRLLELIAAGTPLDECLSALCTTVSRLNPGVRAAVLLTDDGRQSFRRPIAPELLPAFGEGLEGLPINDLLIGACGEAEFHGKPIACEDIANDETWSKEWRDLCVACDVLAGHFTPILGAGGRALGSFFLCFDEPRAPNEWEYRLADFGVHVASNAIERDRANKALRESEQRFRTMMEQSPLSMQIFAPDGRTLMVNSAWERLWDASRKELGDYNILKDSQLESVGLMPYIRRAFSGEVTRLPAIYYDPAQIGKNGRPRWLDAVMYPLISRGGQTVEVALVHHDITERKEAEATLDAARAEAETERGRLAELIAQAPAAIAVLRGPEHLFELANEHYLRFIGDRDVVGKPIREALPELAGQGIYELLDEVYRTGEPFVADGTAVMVDYQGNGVPEEHFFNFVYQPILEAGGSTSGIFLHAVEVTDQVRARQRVEELAAELKVLNESLEQRVVERTAALADSEEQLRRMATRLTMAEQEERRRVSQILHDDLQQQLYAVQMKLSFSQQEVRTGDANAALKSIAEAEEWIQQSIALTRQLTVDLSPPILESEGLTEMLGWLVSQMEETHSLEVALVAEQPFRIPDQDMRMLLFQIVRELLFNVVKHADADRATVELYNGDHRLVIRISDDGCGFDVRRVALAEGKGGFGLFSARERLGLFGGRMEIESAPSEGTRVTLNVPLSLA